jgi:putative spermidine/putrescine transport system substrate-binding protein
MKLKKSGLVAGAAVLGLFGTVVGTTGAASASPGLSSSANNPTSLGGYGTMAKLVAAAQKEGTLNVITLPADWANYGNIIKDFSKKYGIKINSANPDGTSADEINAVKTLKGQSRAPDVLDMGTSFAISAAAEGLLAPYKVQSWNSIPDAAKASNGDWFDDYGGYVAIGYDSSKVKTPPTSFKSLLNPIYKNEVALNGSPTSAGAAFAAVYAAALANGGSYGNIQPGINYFQKLHQVGNFVPVTGSPSTVQSGQTPILIWWDYLQESEVATQDKNWKVVIPTDGHYAAYYSQAINATAPHPAAARLWEEYLYSTTGQNLWLQGFARPIELATLIKNGTVDKAANAALPPAPKAAITFPSQAQQNTANALVVQKWAAAVSG